MLLRTRRPDAVGKMKQFATYFTHGVRNGSKLRADIYHAHEVQQILDLVDAFFGNRALVQLETHSTYYGRGLPRQSRTRRMGLHSALRQSKRELFGSIPHTTNNRMELTAVIEGLKACKRTARWRSSRIPST